MSRLAVEIPYNEGQNIASAVCGGEALQLAFQQQRFRVLQQFFNPDKEAYCF